MLSPHFLSYMVVEAEECFLPRQLRTSSRPWTAIRASANKAGPKKQIWITGYTFLDFRGFERRYCPPRGRLCRLLSMWFGLLDEEVFLINADLKGMFFRPNPLYTYLDFGRSSIFGQL